MISCVIPISRSFDYAPGMIHKSVLLYEEVTMIQFLPGPFSIQSVLPVPAMMQIAGIASYESGSRINSPVLPETYCS